MTNVTSEQIDAILESLVTQNPNDVINPVAQIVTDSDKFMKIVQMSTILAMKTVIDSIDKTKDISRAAEAFNAMEAEILNGLANLSCIMLETGYRLASGRSDVAELERLLGLEAN